MLEVVNTREVTLQKLRAADLFVLDVDGTLAERQENVTPGLASTLVHCGKKLGVATSRALDELDEVFEGSGVTRPILMTGPVILEDGGLVIYPGDKEPTLLIGPDEYEAIAEFMHYVKSALWRVDGSAWQQLGDSKGPLVQVPFYYDYKASGSIWQQVLNGVPRNLEKTMAWAVRAVEDLGIQDLVALNEIGDGTLRISVPGRNKGVALADLHAQGIIDLSKMVYFCDGRNDVPAALAVREGGGCVVAVNDRCEELVALADLVTREHGPRGLQALIGAM